MPDWRNEAGYAFTENLTPEGWAWEFVRRNPKYREAYEEVIGLEEVEIAKYGPYPTRHNAKSDHRFYYVPERLEDETIIDWISRCEAEGHNPERYPPSVGVAREWGITSELPDPNDNNPSMRFVDPSVKPDIVDWHRLHEYFEGDESDHQQRLDKVVLAFDLLLPLTPQLKAAKDILKSKADERGHGSHRGRVSQKYTDKWKTYLRILDAKVSHVPLGEIAAVLFPERKDGVEYEHNASKFAADTLSQALAMTAKERYLGCLLLNS